MKAAMTRDFWRWIGLAIIFVSFYVPHRVVYEGWPDKTTLWSDSLLLVVGIFLLIGVQVVKLYLAYKKDAK